jgi:predicted permease
MFDNLRGGLRALFFRRQTDRELDAELQDYLQRAAEDKVRSGMSEESALRAARVEFGAAEAIRDQVRDAGWESAVLSVWSDLRFAVRMMRRNPGFTAVVVMTLALGIGANTALFTVVNAVLLKPLPVKNPDELALMVWDSKSNKVPFAHGYDGSASSDNSPTGYLEGTSFPYRTLERMGEVSRVFSSVFAFAAIEQLNVIVDGKAEVASGQYVSGDYYEGLGVRAWRGRVLTEADQAGGAEPVAVITWRYWQRRFGGEAGTIGKTATINNVRFTIVGVSPPEFDGAGEMGQSADVTIPMSTNLLVEPGNSSMGKPGLWWLHIMARLQPGVNLKQAQSRMEPVFLQSALDAMNAAPPKDGEGQTGPIGPQDYPHLMVNPGAQGDEFAKRKYREPLGVLMTVVGMVLLIACINVASLLLTRGAARQQEYAMRLALGARRGRLIRQSLTESLLLSAISGVVGCLLALWGKKLLLEWAAWIRGESTLQTGLDLRVLGFALGISLLTGILFGIAPALRAGRTQLAPSVKTQIGNSGRSRTLAGRLLIVAQVAVSLVLLVAAGLFLRTLRNLTTVDAGFDRNNLLLFRVKPQSNGYNDKNIGSLYDRMIERLSSLPGVEGVSLSRHPLLSFSHRKDRLYLAHGDAHNGDTVEVNVVSPSFFKTMEIPVVLGRLLHESDTPSAPRVVVVNQTFAQLYFAGINPIGQQFWMGEGGEGIGSPMRKALDAPPNDRPMEVVGVSRDAKYTDLRSPVEPTVYQPYMQVPTTQANFEVRFRGDTATIAPTVREAVRQVDSRLPIFDMRMQTDQSDASLAEERMFANLASSMGALSLLLAAVGLYGVMSYSVRRRTAEIGVRMALGAQRPAVLAMVLRESFALVVAGVAVGIPIAVATARAASNSLSDLLFGIKPVDPLSFALAAATMLVVALLAGYLPARRASQIDPMVALRQE